ncbi:MAG TPA: hypothetical protein VFS32_15080 [Candidatus Limnocylindrales bacterium]|nr:hypothetical protein [Candidatus Limnocylindrales bacterium]
MNALPPTRLPAPLAGRLRGSRRATPAAGALISLVAFVVSGCGTVPSSPLPASSSAGSTAATPARSAIESPSPSPAPDISGLVLAGDGSPALGVLAGPGTLTPLEAPSTPITFLRGTPSGLLAVLRDGTVAIVRVDGSATRWTVDRRFNGVAAAAVDPSGAMLAIENRRPFDEGGLLTLRIAPLAAGPSRRITVSRLRSNGPPVWLSDGRVAVVATTTAGADVLAVIDAGTGTATTLPFDAVDLVASADGKTAALVEAAAVRVGPADELGQASFGQPVNVVPPAGAQLAEAALDGTGERIAFAWEDEDLTPFAIEVATAASGWQVVSRVDVPAGATRIRLAWVS